MMKKLILLILVMIISFKTFGTTKLSSFLKVDLTEIRSIKKSSKIGYENDYLFIAKVKKLSEVSSNGKEKTLLPKNSFVEIMASKNVCYDEVKMALLASGTIDLQITNTKKLFFKSTPLKKDYSGFLKIEPIKSNENKFAGCVLNKMFF